MCERQNGELVGGVAVVVKATSLVVHIDASNTKLLFFIVYVSNYCKVYTVCLTTFVHPIVVQIMPYKVCAHHAL